MSNNRNNDAYQGSLSYYASINQSMQAISSQINAITYQAPQPRNPQSTVVSRIGTKAREVWRKASDAADAAAREATKNAYRDALANELSTQLLACPEPLYADLFLEELLSLVDVDLTDETAATLNELAERIKNAAGLK